MGGTEPRSVSGTVAELRGDAIQGVGEAGEVNRVARPAGYAEDVLARVDDHARAIVQGDDALGDRGRAPGVGGEEGLDAEVQFARAEAVLGRGKVKPMLLVADGQAGVPQGASG